jgi:hypothetical protein
MSKRILVFMGTVAIGFWCVGCSASVNVFEHDHPRRATIVRVDEGHVCSGDCDHYYHEGRYLVIRGHHHGPGCGHHLEGIRWVLD